jgi:hypothetical protein
MKSPTPRTPALTPQRLAPTHLARPLNSPPILQAPTFNFSRPGMSSNVRMWTCFRSLGPQRLGLERLNLNPAERLQWVAHA